MIRRTTPFGIFLALFTIFLAVVTALPVQAAWWWYLLAVIVLGVLSIPIAGKQR